MPIFAVTNPLKPCAMARNATFYRVVLANRRKRLSQAPKASQEAAANKSKTPKKS